MQTIVTTRHGELSESSRQVLVKKAEKLGRFFERLTAIEVVVDLKDEHRPRVDIKVSAEHKHDFIGHDQSENLLTALESAVQKVEQQLRKYKERVQTRARSPEARRWEGAGITSDGATESATEDHETSGDDVPARDRPKEDSAS